jgi:N-acetylglutamate synthase-like GNAT family acetyltransferase
VLEKLACSYSVEKIAPLCFPLVNRFYKQCGYAVNCGRLEQVYCLRNQCADATMILAAARYLPQADYWVLRNLCVDPQWRQQGLARLLMQQSLEILEQKTVYCFALGYLQPFYESLGFKCLEPEQTPLAIAEGYRRYSQQQPHLVLMHRV